MGCACIAKINMLSPTILPYEFYPRLCSTIGRKIIKKFYAFTAIQIYVESLSLVKTSLRCQWDLIGMCMAFTFLGCTILLVSQVRNERARCAQAGTTDAGGDTEYMSNLPTAEHLLLHAKIPSPQKISFTVALPSCLVSDSPFFCNSNVVLINSSFEVRRRMASNKCEIYWTAMIHWQ